MIAIGEALQGRRYVSPAVARGLADGGFDVHRPDTRLRELSQREREVLQLIAEGKSMKEVAAVLEISRRTVEFHKYRIMDLLKVRTGAELVQYAIKHGLIVP